MLSRVRVRRPKPVALAPWAGTLGQACTEIKANPARGFVGKASRGAHQIRVTSLLRLRAEEVAGGAGISVIAGGAVEVRVSAGADGRINTGIGRALVAVIAEIDIEMAAACSAHTDKAVIASVADLTEESLLHAPPGKIADAL